MKTLTIIAAVALAAAFSLTTGATSAPDDGCAAFIADCQNGSWGESRCNDGILDDPISPARSGVDIEHGFIVHTCDVTCSGANGNWAFNVFGRYKVGGACVVPATPAPNPAPCDPDAICCWDDPVNPCP